MQLSPEAQKIWDMSEVYSELAPKYLMPGPPRRPLKPGEFGGEKERARILFLFPGFPADSINDLLWTQAEHFIVEGAQETEKKTQSLESAQFAEHREAHAAESRKNIERALHALTPIQQEIIRVKIFREK